MTGTGPQLSGPTDGPATIAARVLELGDELRREGVALGTSELLDALSALEHVDWHTPRNFREALSATLAKSPEDRRIYEQVFERFFVRATELAALNAGVREHERGAGVAALDLAALAQRITQALSEGSESELRDLARLAIAALARQDERAGPPGVDLQRIRGALDLQGSHSLGGGGHRPPRGDGRTRSAQQRFEALLRQELERTQIEHTGRLPPARPLHELDRALPRSPAQDLAEVHRVVAQLRRTLATQGWHERGRRRRGHVDVRRTMRASLQTGGVPVVLKQRPRRPRRPELFVVCDVSTSVTSASVFFLSVLHALHDAFRKMRSFVFIERVSEVTDVFERIRDFGRINAAISSNAGVADVTGYTDYGRVWSELLDMIGDDLDPRASVIVLGDARTNGREPAPELFAQIAARAGRMLWLNPEPRLYWNYGDSEIATYEPYCEVFECSTTAQLADFVRALARSRAQA